MPIVRFPIFPKLMGHPGYWDEQHPEHADLVRQAGEEFERAAESKTRDAARSTNELPQNIDASDFEARLFDHYLERLKKREGGVMQDKVAGLTFKGVTQTTLDGLHKLGGKWKELPVKPTELSDVQIADIYRDEYFAKSGAGQIAAMPGVLTRTPELAEQLFDTGVQHGPVKAGKLLQAALDRELAGSDLRSRRGSAEPFYDGLIGERTYAALRRAIAEEKLDAVNDRMAALRLEEIKKGKNYQNDPRLRTGMENRVKSFLTSNRNGRQPHGSSQQR